MRKTKDGHPLALSAETLRKLTAGEGDPPNPGPIFTSPSWGCGGGTAAPTGGLNGCADAVGRRIVG